MTIHVSIRVLSILAALAVLAGVIFGVSLAVFEWRDESPSAADVEALNARLADIEGTVRGVSSQVSVAVAHSHNDCGEGVVGYVQALTSLLRQLDGLFPSGRSLEEQVDLLNIQVANLKERCR